MLDLGNYTSLFGGIIYFFIFLLGLILGSFLNSWMWRVRDNVRVLANSRSICVACRRQLKWYENIPLISWLVLKGRCRTCKVKISLFYPLVELTTACLLVFVVWRYFSMGHFSEWEMLRDVFFLTFLIIIFVYDLRYKIILSRIVWSGAIIGFLINVFYLNYSASLLWLGMLVGGGFFYFQYLISKGRWIGGGDVRMGIMMGAWLGWPNVLVALFFAYILGAVFALILMFLKKADGKTEVPFGTFLAIGTFFTIYHGGAVLDWYLRFLK